jgi:hypothetical protein
LKRKRSKKKSGYRDRSLGGVSLYLLDRFSIEDIHAWIEQRDRLQELHWKFYSTLAYQRSKIFQQISESLLNASEGPFEFKRWQRAVKYKYSLEPLSSCGSLVDPGGRFNIGKIDPLKFSPFPALYIAENKKTALEEMLCQKMDSTTRLSPVELALTSEDSLSVVSVSGRLDRVIDLDHVSNLHEFVNLIKDFEIPAEILKTAEDMGLGRPEVIRSTEQLKIKLMEQEWRLLPMQYDQPATSQIFGQLVHASGIEAIVFPSKYSGGKCLAAFPDKFSGSKSFIELDDVPPPGVKTKRLDTDSWHLLV